MKRFRVSFGFRHGLWILPRNAFVVVFYVLIRDLDRLAVAIGTLKDILTAAGQRQLADKIVFDVHEAE